MNVISLFSGAGGLDLGFMWAGFQIIWAIDNFKEAVSTYRQNLGDHIVCGDIETVRIEHVPDADVIIGGFPCQGFSVANMKRSKTDGRNKLYQNFVGFIEEKKPKYFIAENVRGILSLSKGRVFEQILDDFSSDGYNVQHAVLNAADYGVPQRRERVFLFGVRNDIRGNSYSFPPARTHAPPNVANCLDLPPSILWRMFEARS